MGPMHRCFALAPQASLRARDLLWAAGASVLLAACAPSASFSPEASTRAESLRRLTGAQTRVVWVQDVENRNDYGGLKTRKALVAFDTEDGRGERLLLPEFGPWVKPLITPGGERVVFSDFRRPTVLVVNWDGTGLRPIAQGVAIEVWRDPETGRDWVYVLRGESASGEFDENPVYRYSLDEPDHSELVWEKTSVSAMSAGSFQLSADGRRAAGLFPWEAAGILDLEKNDWTRIGNGCWTGMSPDNSYRAWVFDGRHRNLVIYGADGRTTAKVEIGRVVEDPRDEVYHPRWSNHPRFFSLTGPYQRLADAGNPGVEVVVARFNRDFTGLEEWVTLTSNRRGDYYPDVWVARDPLDEQAESGARGPDLAGSAPEPAWPGDMAGLVFRWENARARNDVPGAEEGAMRICDVVAQGHARIGRFHGMDLLGGNGSFVARQGLDEAALAALREGYGFTLEATVMPAAITGGVVPVISYGSGPEHRNFALLQEGDEMRLHLRTEQTEAAEGVLELGRVPVGEVFHLAITYEPHGRWVGYVNGVEVARQSDVKGGLASWSAGKLRFGGGLPAGQHSWSGLLDGVALYDWGMDQQQIALHARNNAERIAGRAPAPRLVVQAVLQEATPAPEPEAIAPYQRCLVVARYRVDRVLQGRLEGREILVAHWAIMDGSPVEVDRARPGELAELHLEPFDEHPQLISERMDMGMTDFDLPMFYERIPGGGAIGAMALLDAAARGSSAH